MSRIFGDFGDARLNNYFLEHGYQYIIGNHVSFWSAPFFYPAQYVMTYSDNHIGTLPFYTLFRTLDLDIETSYQLWQLTMFSLNSLSAYYVLRLLKFNCLSSLVAALFFSISAPVIAKVGHIQLIPRFMVPIIFYCLMKFLETIRLKYFYIFCIALVYQFYIGIYIGFFTIITIFLISPFAFIHIKKNFGFGRFIEKHYFIRISIAISLSFIALYALFRPYIKFKESAGGRSWYEVSSMLPRWESWLYSNNGPIEYFNQIGLNLPMQHEHVLFVGILPIVSIIFSLVCLLVKNSAYSGSGFKEYSMPVISSLLMIFLVLVATLYFSGFSLYKYLFFNLPGFDAIRAVTRIILLLLFPISILISFLISSIYSSTKLNYIVKIGMLFLVLIAGITEQYRNFIPTYDKSEAQKRYLFVANSLSKFNDYDVFYYEYNKGSKPFSIFDELDAMFISLVLNTNTINGYSGNQPKGYWPLNNHRYDYWLNEGGLDFDKVRVLKYNPGTRSAVIDVVSRSDANIVFTSTEKPLGEYGFNIDLLKKYNGSTVELTIENNSSVNWPSIYNGMYGIALSYAVKGTNDYIEYENRTFLPYDIPAGQKIKIKFNLVGLNVGSNEVCFNMVQDGVRWFSESNRFCTIVVLE
ncbi:YfhO family protein [Vibrio cholerae]|uniref:YfhO family protein n=1 Tax=Vibrio cholerae TaxID=666 RepID=UPI0011D405F6|nr:YfhO family protein [Vibrio cholerae]TXZ49446.1 YfhO family protein [Vibrio cholerae]